VEKHHGALLFLIHALPRLGIADGATSPWAAGGEETWGGTGSRWRRNLERNDISQVEIGLEEVGGAARRTRTGHDGGKGGRGRRWPELAMGAVLTGGQWGNLDGEEDNSERGILSHVYLATCPIMPFCCPIIPILLPIMPIYLCLYNIIHIYCLKLHNRCALLL
jgi:hypothetical protein